MLQIQQPGFSCRARPSGVWKHLIEAAVATCSPPPLSPMSYGAR
ncbi:hypothetical protein RchiOBHm_Chr2g0164871 [Rosa chinensis]|uniref:Uncharacterized protein n=1 Tax=Rosa chinensis TaxID=74649 RepID=A0A2P6S3P1_ROSCH|nr:hypothetical protein RchiOBHm_Chr2g0164871 [Rosa chinensis]